MKLYGEEDDIAPILDLGNQQDLNTFAGLYQQVVGPQDVPTSAYEQGAPVDLEKLWNDIYGPGIPFPDTSAVDEFGRPIINQQTNQIVPDIQKYNQVIDALESRVGSLSRYGLDRDADYQLIDLGDQYESDIVISGGKVTKINTTTGAQSPEVSAGRLRQDIGVQMPGYDVLEQRTGELSAVQQRVDPGYIIDPKTMQPYFQQPDGSLQAAPTPSVDDQISMPLVDGNMDAAVSKANFRDRPTSLEYFNAAMDWARTPADIFTISAIVRGVFEPTPGPMGELRRVGAPPAWATQAWVGLQNSMGVPAESMTMTPNGEPGSVNEMMVASSSGLVPNNFVSASSAPVTLDGKTVFQPATANIRPDTTVQGLDDLGNIGAPDIPIDSNMFGGQTTMFPSPDAQPIVQPTGQLMGQPTGQSTFPPSSINSLFSMGGSNRTEAGQMGGDQRVFLEYQPGLVQLPNTDYFVTEDTLRQLQNLGNDRATQRELYESLALEGDDLATQAGVLDAEREKIQVYGQDGTPLTIMAGQLDDALDKGWLDYDPTAPTEGGFIISGPGGREATITEGYFRQVLNEAQRDLLEREASGELSTGEAIEAVINIGDGGEGISPENQALIDSLHENWAASQGTSAISDADLFQKIVDQGQGDLLIDAVPDWAATAGRFNQAMDIEDYGVLEGPVSSFEDLLAASQDRQATRASGADFYYGEDVGSRLPKYGDLSAGGDDFGDFVPMPGVAYEPEQISVGGLSEGGSTYGTASYEPMSEDEMFSFGPGSYGRQLEEFEAGSPYAGERREFAYEQERRNRIEEAARQYPDMPYTSVGQAEILDMSLPSSDMFDIPGQEGLVSRSWLNSPERWAEMGEEYEATRTGNPFLGAEIPDYAEEEEEEWEDVNYYDDPMFDDAPVSFTPEVFTPEPLMMGDPLPEPVDYSPIAEPEPEWEPVYYESADDDWDWDMDFFANGGTSFGGMAMVGEEGPELVDLPPGAEVMPAGITEMMTGRPTRRPRSLFRQAGMRAPSAQTISNLLPEEIEVYQEIGRLAGIPEKAFEREFRSMVPMGQGGTRQARFTPRGTGRTRYGNT